MKKGSEIFIVAASSIGGEEEFEWEDRHTRINYCSAEEAIDAAVEMAKELNIDYPEDIVIVTVMAGEYETENGDIFGEPYDIYAVSSRGVFETQLARTKHGYVSAKVDGYIINNGEFFEL